MNPDLETAISGENEAPSHRLRWLLLILLTSILVLSSTVWYLTSSSPTTEQAKRDQEFNAKIQQIVEKYKNQPFVFTLVPDALTTITLPPPPDSDASDLVSYQAVQKQLIPEMIADIDNDTMFNTFTLPGFKYSYLFDSNINQNNEKFYQLHDEIRFLVLKFNKQYQRPPLSKRLPNVQHYGTEYPAVPGNDDVPSTYPSVRATEGFAVAELLTRLDNDNADFYQEMADDYARRGIMYGWYGQSDVAAARSLVDQYFTQFDKSVDISSFNSTFNIF